MKPGAIPPPQLAACRLCPTVDRGQLVEVHSRRELFTFQVDREDRLVIIIISPGQLFASFVGNPRFESVIQIGGSLGISKAQKLFGLLDGAREHKATIQHVQYSHMVVVPRGPCFLPLANQFSQGSEQMKL